MAEAGKLDGNETPQGTDNEKLQAAGGAAPQAAGGESLRVLAGVQQGAEIELENRRTYSIGSGDDCNIVLLGDDVAAIHIEAAYLFGALSVLRCEQGVMLDSKPLPDLPTTVSAGQLLSFGGVVLVFGGADLDWEDLTEKAAQIVAEQQPEQSSQESDEPEQPRQQRRRFPTAAIAAVSVLVVVVVLAGAGLLLSGDQQEAGSDGGDGSSADQQATGASAGIDKISGLISANPEYSEVELVKSSGNAGVELVGLLDSTAAEREIRKIASASDVRTRVALKPQLLEGLKLALEKYDAGLSYDLRVKDGQIILRIGGIRDSDDTEILKKSIRDNIPVIDRIDVSAAPLSKVLAEIKTEIANNPQYGNVEIHYSGGAALDVRGSLLENFDKPGIDRILASYEPHELVVREQFDTGPYFDGNVTSVLIGNKKHAVIDFFGREIRVALGSRLPGNFKLVNIARDKLNLEYDGIEYVYPTSTNVPNNVHSE